MGIMPAVVRAMTYVDLLNCMIAHRDMHRTGRGPITADEDAALDALGEAFSREIHESAN